MEEVAPGFIEFNSPLLLIQWNQNYTALQAWPFNYVDYHKPDFHLHTDPCSHTKPFVYSETAWDHLPVHCSQQDMALNFCAYA